MKTVFSKGLFFLFLLLSRYQHGLAQNDYFRFEHMGVEEGLSAGNVTSILQDSKGYLWFGAWNGSKPTGINALADEYLKLAYHGLRTMDKSFSVILKTDHDESIGKINIIPQDIGRVLLNLYNNAFYAVKEKKNSNANNYEPTVTVSSSLKPPSGGRGAGVLISVRDNGPGIPQKVIDKIFQPFFTTKPTGQGTGLGLSLAYDIIKTHDGELKVLTKEDESSEFIIYLPII